MAHAKTGLFILPLLMALALALFTEPRTAVAQAPGWHPAPLLIAQKHRRPVRQRVDDRKIACTKFGCIRIPLGCHPEMGYDLDGMPTGFEIVVCPGR